jgi:hypothetical protein
MRSDDRGNLLISPLLFIEKRYEFIKLIDLETDSINIHYPCFDMKIFRSNQKAFSSNTNPYHDPIILGEFSERLIDKFALSLLGCDSNAALWPTTAIDNILFPFDTVRRQYLLTADMAAHRHGVTKRSCGTLKK